nr:MAG: capsid protein [Astroviridae sp.]
MEGQKPKPQRRRKTVEQKQLKEQKKIVKELKKNDRRGRIKTTSGIEVGYVVSTQSQEKRALKNIERRLKKLDKKVEGPRPQSTMQTSVTLGALEGNIQENLTRKMRVWLNPLLLKPPDQGDVVAPLSLRASQYDLWKVDKLIVKMQPLVGQQMVAGSVFLVDLDQEASAAKPESIDSIKARLHRETSIGKMTTFIIHEKFLKGPRQGWWYVDTNEDPSQSLGPALNFWAYMQTINLLGAANVFTVENPTGPAPPENGVVGRIQKNAYSGPIFMVEIQVRYQFANYNPKPGLAQLQRREAEFAYKTNHTDPGIDSGNISAEQEAFFTNSGEDQSLELVIPHASALYSLFSDLNDPETTYSRATAVEDKGETFWTIASDTINTVAEYFGPWKWLIKGGWIVIRKIFNAPSKASNLPTNSVRYKVYASVEDAAKDSPIREQINYNGKAGVRLPQGNIRVTQINNPNLNGQFQPVLPGARSSRDSPVVIPPYPIIPPCPVPEPCPEDHDFYFLPSGFMGTQKTPVPPLYHFNPETKEYSAYYKGLVQGQLTVTGLPRVSSFRFRSTEDNSLVTPMATFCSIQIGYLPDLVAGDNSNATYCNIHQPGNPDDTRPTTYYWFDLSHTGLFLSTQGQKPPKGDLYWKYGLTHTMHSLWQSIDYAREKGTDNWYTFGLQVAGPIYNSSHETPCYNGFKPLLDAIGIKTLEIGYTIISPMLLYGELFRPGVLIVDSIDKVAGILTNNTCLPNDWRTRPFVATNTKVWNDERVDHWMLGDMQQTQEIAYTPLIRDEDEEEDGIVVLPPTKSWRQLVREVLPQD